MADINKVRRIDREIKDFAEILDVFRRAEVVRLGLNGDPYPYVVPLSFGYEALSGGADGETPCVAVYVHGAPAGYKLDLMARDNHVCVEAGISHGYLRKGAGGASSITALYESVIGYGTAEVVTGAEAKHGMDLMLEHCGHPDFEYDKADLDRAAVLKFTLTNVTGKRNLP